MEEKRARMVGPQILKESENREMMVVIRCSKCGALIVGRRCPDCGISLVGKGGTLENGKLVLLMGSVVCKPPSQSISVLVKRTWICGCGEENIGDTCWKCDGKR